MACRLYGGACVGGPSRPIRMDPFPRSRRSTGVGQRRSDETGTGGGGDPRLGRRRGGGSGRWRTGTGAGFWERDRHPGRASGRRAHRRAHDVAGIDRHPERKGGTDAVPEGLPRHPARLLQRPDRRACAGRLPARPSYLARRPVRDAVRGRRSVRLQCPGAREAARALRLRRALAGRIADVRDPVPGQPRRGRSDLRRPRRSTGARGNSFPARSSTGASPTRR